MNTKLFIIGAFALAVSGAANDAAAQGCAPQGICASYEECAPGRGASFAF